MWTARLDRDSYTGPKHVTHARRVLMGLLFMVTFGLIATSAAVAQEPSNGLNSLTDIEVRALAGNRIELRLVMSNAAPEPLTFTIDDPARIALDLRGTSLDLDVRRKDVGIGVLDTILAAEANGRTRVVLNLDVMVPYETRVADNNIIVTLDSLAFGAVAGAKGVRVQPTKLAIARQEMLVDQSRDIQAIDFRRTASGAGRLIVEFSDVGTPVDVSRSGGQVVLSFSGTSLPDSLMKRLDVMDFATPVNTIDVMRIGGDARIIIAATGQFEELAYQSDTVFTVEVQPIPEEKEQTIATATLFSGKR